jgi:AraC family transcriptional regulator, transcriptional activator of pobA
MKLMLKDSKTGGNLFLFHGEREIESFFYKRDHDNKYFTIAWNIGKKQTIHIDGASHTLMPHTVLPIMFNQHFQFSQATDIVAWQFNREFYCIIDHDAEVSCVGFLFGIGDNIFITLDKKDQQKFQLLLNVFIEEMNTSDHIQNDMVLMLLKRLIIIITRLAKSDYVADKKLSDDRFNVIRKFNLLVEANFRSHHSVTHYAQLLNKSPKTLSNLFALYNEKTPLQIIQERILIEAKRLLYYTDKSAKQITYELGFEDSAYFSAFFKRHTAQSPSDFRNPRDKITQGK